MTNPMKLTLLTPRLWLPNHIMISISFLNKIRQGCLGKWLIADLGQKSFKMNLEHFLYKKLRKHFKVTRPLLEDYESQCVGSSTGQRLNNLNVKEKRNYNGLKHSKYVKTHEFIIMLKAKTAISLIITFEEG